MRLFGGHNTRSSLGRTNDLPDPSEPRPLEAKRKKEKRKESLPVNGLFVPSSLGTFISAFYSGNVFTSYGGMQ